MHLKLLAAQFEVKNQNGVNDVWRMKATRPWLVGTGVRVRVASHIALKAPHYYYYYDK